MDMNTVIVLGAALACAFSAYVLWKSKQDGLSFVMEVKKQLDGHKSETVKATVAAVQAIQATPVAPAPVAPAVEAPVPVPESIWAIPATAPRPPFNMLETVKDNERMVKVGSVGAIGLYQTQPKETPVRDEMTEGPKLMVALPERLYPGIGHAGGQVIHWYCTHEGSTYEQAYKAVVIDGASNYASAVEQPYRTGKFPVEVLDGNVLASVYLNYMSGAYTAAVHRSIWVDMLRGEKDLVSMFINLGGSTNAGMLGTFDPDGYSGPVKDAVVQAMEAA